MTASKTQLTGGLFQDAEGNVLNLGYLIFKLNQDNSVTGVAAICSGIEIKVLLNSSGSISTSPAQYIWATDVMSVSNAFYTVTGYSAAGQPCWGPNNQQVTSGGVGGGTFDAGTWVPNTIFSWTPPLQPLVLQVNGTLASSQLLQDLESSDASVTITDRGSGVIDFQVPAPSPAITFEVGGVAASSQILQNLESTDGSVTITDEGGGTINFQAPLAPAFPTAGFGYFWSFAGVLEAGGQAATSVNITQGSSANSATANQVICFQLMLKVAYTVRNISVFMSGAVSGHASCAIYNSAGTKIVDAGANAFDTSNVSTLQTATLGAAVVLQPGVYWFACSSTASAAASSVGSSLTSGPAGYNAYFNGNAVRAGIATNPMSSGAMPASLGVITALTSGTFSCPGFFFQV